MSNPNAVPTVRIKNPAGDGFLVVNAVDFDHDEHELYDKKDKSLVPPRSAKAVSAEATDLKDLLKKLGMAEDRVVEAELERDEMKVRAETAEKALAELQAAQEPANKKK